MVPRALRLQSYQERDSAERSTHGGDDATGRRHSGRTHLLRPIREAGLALLLVAVLTVLAGNNSQTFVESAASQGRGLPAVEVEVGGEYAPQFGAGTRVVASLELGIECPSTRVCVAERPKTKAAFLRAICLFSP
jgi:hypothetical protein